MAPYQLPNQDRQVLNEILNDPNNDLEFFHQLGQGLIDSYLKTADSDSVHAALYRKMPRCSTLHAFSAANQCENIYTQDGVDVFTLVGC